jgi:hypothetical protein
MRKQLDKTAELNQIFGGLDTIYSTFSSFGVELKAAMEKWQETEELGDVISKWVCAGNNFVNFLFFGTYIWSRP